MATEAQQQMARREYWKDVFAQALGWDDPYRYGDVDANLEAMADHAIEVEVAHERVNTMEGGAS